MRLVVDASVALKWGLDEPDSPVAKELLDTESGLIVPDFWLNEATNVLWLQVRRKLFTPSQARATLDLLLTAVEPVPTSDMRLHKAALAIGLAVNHSPYDTLYVAFALAVDADAVILSDAPFVRAMRTHPDPALAALMLPLDDWARSRGLA